MRLRPYAAVASLTVVAVFGATACTTPSPTSYPSGSPSISQEPSAEVPVGGDDVAYRSLAAAMTATMAQNSYRLSIDSAGMDLEITVDYQARLLRMLASGTADGEKIDAEIRGIGDDVYLMYRGGELAESTEGKWAKMGAGGMNGEDVFSINTLFDPAKLLNKDTPVTGAGDNKYQVTPTGDALVLPSLFSDMIDGGGTGFDAKSLLVTVGADGNVSTMVVSSGGGGQKAVIKVTDFGTTVSVDRPADKDVIGG